jgi:hypothetical protein
MRYIILIFCVSTFQFIYGQSTATFEKTVHNFGELEELREGVDYSFQFMNESPDTLRITYVKASCGCTIPGWTKEPIAPGGKGEVKAHYNTYNRPGAFNKSLRINWANGAKQTLYIQGNVLPRTKSIEEELPVLVGSIRSKYKAFNMGNFDTEKPARKSFAIYNDSDDTIRLLPDQHKLPEYLALEVRSDTIYPGKKARLTLVVDPEKVGELGFVQHEMRLATTDATIPVKSYQVYSTIEEYFPPMSDEEKANAPKLIFSEGTIDFGQLNVGTTIEKTITLSNQGKSSLNIRQIKSNCDCVKTKLKKDNVKPGNTVDLVITFDASGRKGRQYKTLTVFSNDPSRPTQTLSIKAYVK